ncbi:hypothetical protein [Bacillus seohaeanensis]|uniref:Fibronectin type-III domain-containing protein n=1 Tax=Bacillus seohaeanensis TaxID=284580 RepID=A0ABW5RSH0_9BACI
MDINSILMAHGVIKGGGGSSSKDTIPPPPITNFKVDSVGDGFVNLSWTNPDDTDFAGVKIQRKEGGYPSSPTDGITAYDGLDSTITDSGLTNSVEYFYRAFTYDFDDNFNQDVGQQVSGMPVVGDDPNAIGGLLNLVAGIMDAGYFGTVPSSEFIDGDTLASEIGLTAGNSQYPTADWLKFAIDEKVILSPTESFRYNISWNDINNVDAVYGNKTIIINGLTFKVKLWRGAENNPSKNTDSDRDAIGSEWNRLILPIHVNAPSSWTYPSYGGVTEDWGIDFTDEYLHLDQFNGNGSYIWCQENIEGDNSVIVLRGKNGATYAGYGASSIISVDYGWRPVLELVQ